MGIASDAAGNLYIADSGSNMIRKLTPAGVMSILAGNGSQGHADGTGPAAQFNYPNGVAVDQHGNVYVADTGNNLIRRITPTGVVTTLAGSGAYDYVNGTGTGAAFRNPAGLAVDAASNVYVADTANSSIREVSPAGVVTTVAGAYGQAGGANGPGPMASFVTPGAVALDAKGNLYVADIGADEVREITPAHVVSTLAGQEGVAGSMNGTGTGATFTHPDGIAVDAKGNVYVGDDENLLRKITPAGVVTTFAGSVQGLQDGPGTTALFDRIQGLALGRGGSLVVLDRSGIRNVTLTGVVTTNPPVPLFDSPCGVAVDAFGTIYTADTGNNVIRKLTSDGVVTTLAGRAGIAGHLDGQGTLAEFAAPEALAVDANGNIFVADTGNSIIREITPGGLVSTLAGDPGVPGSSDGTGPAAKFNHPRGVAVDSGGIVYVSDFGNNSVRIISPDHAVATISGAQIAEPVGIAVDGQQDIFVVSEQDDDVQEISADGVFSVYAGVPGSGGATNGDKAVAQFLSPAGLALDAGGNLFVADTGNNLLREINTAGQVSTVSGAGVPGFYDGADGGATFSGLKGVAVDSSGNIDVADTSNHLIRQALLEKLPGIPGTIGSTYALDSVDLNGFPISYFVQSGPAIISGPRFNLLTFLGLGDVVVGSQTGSGHSGNAGTQPNQPTYATQSSKKTAAVNVGSMEWTYTGKTKMPVITTSPAGLKVSVTFQDSSGVPVNAPFDVGTYTASATIEDAIYQGTGNGTLTIDPIEATVKLGALTGTSNGKAHAVTATTTPARLPVLITYDGSPAPPTSVGSYNVVATVNKANYAGSATGTLVILPPPPLAVTGVASDIEATQANVTSSITTQNADTGVQFWYGPSKTSLTLATATTDVFASNEPVTVNFTLLNLEPNTTYYYEVRATSAGGVKTGAVKTFKTTP
jgi:sugar lactone lactonase YvrE